MRHSTPPRTSAWGAFALWAVLSAAAPAGAQAPYPTGPGQASPLVGAPATANAGYGAPARDDVQWEERRAPYDGGPIRPGAQLEGSVSALVWLGVVGLAGGFGLSIVLGVVNERAYGAIPIAGPWLAVANVGNDGLSWETPTVAGMVVAGILQPVGVALIAIGAVTPNLSLVYDAPVGAPDGYARLRLAPFAPGAEAGVSLTLEAL